MSSFSIYRSETKQPYFVDKTELLRELFPLVEAGNNHICITRPRRFGKSIMAAMIAAFFSKGMDSSSIFDSLSIAKKRPKDSDDSVKSDDTLDSDDSVETDDLLDSDKSVESCESEDAMDESDYHDYMNQYNVIYINFIDPANESTSYEEFIGSVKEVLQEDLREAFPDMSFIHVT